MSKKRDSEATFSVRVRLRGIVLKDLDEVKRLSREIIERSSQPGAGIEVETGICEHVAMWDSKK